MAKDYVECMWLILQHHQPEDFVIATGVQHSVREFCQLAFHYAGIELEFKGEGLEEKGIDKATGKVLVEVSPDFYRPTDIVISGVILPRLARSWAGILSKPPLRN